MNKKKKQFSISSLSTEHLYLSPAIQPEDFTSRYKSNIHKMKNKQEKGRNHVEIKKKKKRDLEREKWVNPS